MLLAGIQPHSNPAVARVWIPANRLDPKGVKRENENGAGGETMSKEASIGVRLS